MSEYILPRPHPVGRVIAMKRGFLGRCPACGEGRMFGRYLKVNESCACCGEELHHHRADDMPPYIVMFIVGHIVGYCILVSETRFEIPLMTQIVIWPVLTLGLCLALLQPVKGSIVALQYSLGMHGFGSARRRTHKGSPPHGRDDDPDEHPSVTRS